MRTRGAESREQFIIEQAKGMLANEHQLTPSSAFEVLRDYARARRMKVRQVSRQIVDGTISGKTPSVTSMTGGRSLTGSVMGASWGRLRHPLSTGICIEAGLVSTPVVGWRNLHAFFTRELPAVTAASGPA